LRKRMMALVLVTVFVLSAALTAAYGAATPGCQRCKKDGCPQGYCYFDCVGCCYNSYPYPVCFR